MRRYLGPSLVAWSTVLAGCGSVSEISTDAGAGGDGGEPLFITSAALPSGNRELPYEAQLEARGGVPPYSWSADGLPSALAIDPDGAIAGTPSEAGGFEVSATVTDAAGVSARAELSLTIDNEPRIVTEELPTLHVLRTYEVPIVVLGGTPPYRFGASGLPPGLVIDEDGVVANDGDAPAVNDA
jgi:hypothetical protein